MREAQCRAMCGTLATMSGSGDAARWQERVAAILDVARDLRAAGPQPQGRPFFGLDHRTGTPLRLIDDLATRGIFRKYEHVLDLGAGLGATTRYLTSRLGCTATATARLPGEAAAGRLLTARAALDWQVFHTVADASRLPFVEAAFTHVWVVDVLPALGPSDQVLGEAFRVLRPGGHLGIQEFALRRDDAVFARGGFVARDTRYEQLDHAGFLEIVGRDVDIAGPAVNAEVGWSQLARRLGSEDPIVRERQTIAEAFATGTLGIVQLTARRP